jgi:hypothetical protein
VDPSQNSASVILGPPACSLANFLKLIHALNPLAEHCRGARLRPVDRVPGGRRLAMDYEPSEPEHAADRSDHADAALGVTKRL